MCKGPKGAAPTLAVDCVPASKLHMVDGKYYDLTGFEHPGGLLVLEQSRGTDVTAGVQSHHFTDAPFKVLAQREIPVERVSGSIAQTHYSFKPQGFFQTLKRRVAEHFGKQGVRGPLTTAYKVRVFAAIAAWLVSWLYCCFMPMWAPALALCCGMRMVLTGIGHEAIHGRLQGSLWHIFDLMLLFPSDKWHYEHCLEHHPHCKRFDLDPDETLVFLRMNAKTRWRFWHVAQLGVQLIMSWLLGVAMFIEHHLVDGKLMLQSTVLFFLTQLLPMFTHPDGFVAGLWVHFWVVCWSNCFTLHAFHLSHINEANSALNYEYKDGVDWGEHQLRTSSNWIPFDWFSVTGMLELQIEHHLFPSLSYAQQRDIRHLVKATAKEYNLPYHEYPSILHGISAHMSFMWKLGRSPGELEPGQKLKMR